MNKDVVDVEKLPGLFFCLFKIMKRIQVVIVFMKEGCLVDNMLTR